MRRWKGAPPSCDAARKKRVRMAEFLGQEMQERARMGLNSHPGVPIAQTPGPAAVSGRRNAISSVHEPVAYAAAQRDTCKCN